MGFGFEFWFESAVLVVSASFVLLSGGGLLGGYGCDAAVGLDSGAFCGVGFVVWIVGWSGDGGVVVGLVLGMVVVCLSLNSHSHCISQLSLSLTLSFALIFLWVYKIMCLIWLRCFWGCNFFFSMHVLKGFS